MLDAPSTTAPAPSRSSIARPIASCAAAGAVAGVLVGGVGGRLAMLLLRFTSSDALRGMRTDDQFEIGSFSLVETLFLLFVTAAAGTVGGILYAAVRPHVSAAAFGVLGGLVGGAVIVKPDGVDFRFLDPLPLAVAMFVAIPALGAWLIGRLADRWSSPPRWALPATVTVVPLLPFALVAAVLATGTAIAAGRGVDLRLAVRAVAIVVGAVATVALWRDVVAVL